MEDNKSAAEVVDRKEGYYWIKVNSDSEWEIAMWNGEGRLFRWFTFIGTECSYTEREVFEIDERQICRS